MKNTMTVKELKDLLNNYNDNDEITLRVYAFNTYATAELEIEEDTILKDED